mgnify:CR=1 FL=1
MLVLLCGCVWMSVNCDTACDCVSVFVRGKVLKQPGTLATPIVRLSACPFESMTMTQFLHVPIVTLCFTTNNKTMAADAQFGAAESGSGARRRHPGAVDVVVRRIWIRI